MKLADFTEPFVLPIKHWSASSLNLLATCPRAWQQRYVLKRPERAGQALVMGRAQHRAIEQNYAFKIATGTDMDTDELEQRFGDEIWPAVLDEEGGASEIAWDDDPDTSLLLGLRMVAAYRAQVAPRVEPVAVEQKISVEVGLPVPVIGYIDVVQKDDWPLIDVKTAKKKVSSVKGEWLLQGRIYQLAVPRPVDWHVLTKQATPACYTALELPELLQELENAEVTRAIIRQLSGIANHYLHRYGPDVDWPTLGISHDWKCSYCSYRSDCPAWTPAWTP